MPVTTRSSTNPIQKFYTNLIHSKNEICSYEFAQLLDDSGMFPEYRNWEADYDDVYYYIPLDKWIEKTGLYEKDIEAIDGCFRDYPYCGSFTIYDSDIKDMFDGSVSKVLVLTSEV
jgi:hypothetical protein